MAQIALVAIPVVMYREMTEFEQSCRAENLAIAEQKKLAVMFKLTRNPAMAPLETPENVDVLDADEQRLLLDMVYDDMVYVNTINGMPCQNMVFSGGIQQKFAQSNELANQDAMTSNSESLEIANDIESLDPIESHEEIPHETGSFADERLKESCNTLTNMLTDVFLAYQAEALEKTQHELDLEEIRLRKMQVHLDNQNQMNQQQTYQGSPSNMKTSKKTSWKTGKKPRAKIDNKVINHRCDTDLEWRSDTNRSPASTKSFSGQCDEDSWWRSEAPTSD